MVVCGGGAAAAAMCATLDGMIADPATLPLAATPPAPIARLRVRSLGLVPYAEALAQQRLLHAARLADAIEDTLLLLQHPHVLTLGRNTDAAHILVAEEDLRARGVSVERVERGGSVTYHGPGQLVAYPIIALRAHERNLRALVDNMEEVIRGTLAEFGLAGRRDSSDRGVWVGERKIASVGMAVRRWTVMHGMALNVDPDLSYFACINPCGHPGLEMTSMGRELGAAPPLAAVQAAFVRHFAAVFRREAPDCEAA